MSEQTASLQQFSVSVDEQDGASDLLVFTFVPNEPEPERRANGAPKRVPQFTVTTRQEQNSIQFDWSSSQDDPKSAKKELEKEAELRIAARRRWIDTVTALVSQVETWAKELHWSTRRVEKKLDDDWIGRHRVPALLMQEDTCRIILEPIGRSSSGAQGVVDLYLMPAYDDIANLYFDGNRWNLRYMFAGTKAISTICEADAVTLSKEALKRVFDEMKQNAA